MGREVKVPTPKPVMAIDQYRSNAELIEACVRLGYLQEDWRTLDPTYGFGTFWQRWRPATLIASDLDPVKSPGLVADVRALPFPDRSFDAVVFDGPYKLNGTPTDAAGSDGRYGVHEVTNWRDRMSLLVDGLVECARVLGGGYLLVKCQDQVCSGKVRWQTDVLTDAAGICGLGKVDRLDLLSYRPQPGGRSQVHARRNSSTLLVFKRGWGMEG